MQTNSRTAGWYHSEKYAYWASRRMRAGDRPANSPIFPRWNSFSLREEALLKWTRETKYSHSLPPSSMARATWKTRNRDNVAFPLAISMRLERDLNPARRERTE